MEEQKQEASEDVDMVDKSEQATTNGAGDLSSVGPDNSLSPGGAGNPLSPGGAGNPLSPGGAGNPLSPGGAGNPLSPGGAGNPLSPGGAGNPLSPGGAGNPLSPGGAGNPLSPGGAGNPLSPGGAGNPLSPGGAGNPLSPGGAGNPLSPGGAGNPLSPGGAGNPLSPGGAGNPLSPGGAGNPLSPGGAGNPLSPGGAGNPLSPGGAGNPLSPGGAGNPLSPGGAGNPLSPGGDGNPLSPGGAGNPLSPGGAGNPLSPGGAGNPLSPGGAGNPISPGGPGNSLSPGGPGNPLSPGGADKGQGESAMKLNIEDEDENFSSGPAPDVNMNGEGPLSGQALAGASCPSTSSEQYAPGGKNQEPSDREMEISQEPGSQDRTGTAGGGGAEAAVGGSCREEEQSVQNTEITERQRMEKVGIFLTDLKPDYIWLADYLSKISRDMASNVLPISDVSLEDVIDRNSLHIIHHSMRSQVSRDELQSHLTHFIKRSQPVKVLITDVTDKYSEMKRFWASQAETNKWESLSFTEAELDSIKPDRLKPWTDRNTELKLKGMRDILSRAGFLTKRAQKVGIFSRSSEEDYLWLQTLLRSEGFKDWVQEVRPYYISNSGYSQFRQDVSQCTFGILYHTKNRGRINVTNVTSSLYDKELKYLSDTLGKDKVIVVVDDLDDNSQEMKASILQNQPSIGKLAQDLFLFRTEEKGEWMKYLPALQPVDKEKLQEKLNTVKGWIRLEPTGEPSYLKTQEGCDKVKGFGSEIIDKATSFLKDVSNAWKKPKTPEGKHTVGIFSRSGQDEYSWLQTLLRSEGFRDCVQEVRPCYISNNHQEFIQNVSQCTFGILYHSENKERKDISLTNDLTCLSSTFGKGNVIVVVDDLPDDSLAVKHMILKLHPCIGALAQELILFNRQEKIHSDGRARTQNVLEKQQTIKEMIRAADKRIRPSDQSHGSQHPRKNSISTHQLQGVRDKITFKF
ncbi:uncharacterized protein LOC134571372 [Pelobates fuscus]|uniref:uncharacterized protein LOC134571372 n=1 Tax=Pelobates fuscus TaxID=191477 RepID=UPI002FE4BA1C